MAQRDTRIQARIAVENALRDTNRVLEYIAIGRERRDYWLAYHQLRETARALEEAADFCLMEMLRPEGF